MSNLTAENSTYRPDQAVIFTGQDVALLRAAFEEILKDAQTATFVNKFKYFDNELQDYVPEDQVTEEMLKLGKVRKLYDPYESMKTSNMVHGMDANKITPIIKEAYLTLMHRQEVDARQGLTISIEQFKKDYVDAKNNNQADSSNTEEAADGSN